MPGGANATINHVKGAGDPAAVFGNRSEIFRAAGARSTRQHSDFFQTCPKEKTGENRNAPQWYKVRDKLGVVSTKINFCAHSSEGNRAARAGKIRLVHATDKGPKSDTSPFTIRFQLSAPSGLNFPANRSSKTVKTDHQNPSGDQHRDAQKVGRKKIMAAVKKWV